MRKKVYHLGNCGTCQRIIKDLGIGEEFEYQNIKTDPMTADQVDEMREMAGSYEALFSRRAMKYKSWGLKDKELKEQDYRNYIIEEYTFLKRPVFLIGEEIFIGNTKKVIEAIAGKLSQ